MSATNRGADRVADDNYPTPAWCTRRILEALSLTRRRSTWLEPCAGDGAIVRILDGTLTDCYINGGDVRNLPSCVPHCWTIGGFNTHVAYHDAVITNPPFSLAPELIRHFRPRCDWLILLLRSAFRLSEWRHDMPDEYKLPNRPEFVASEKCTRCCWSRKVSLTVAPLRVCPVCKGKVQRSTTDSAEYSWFVWTPERNRDTGLMRVLPDTPLEERKADR